MAVVRSKLVKDQVLAYKERYQITNAKNTAISRYLKEVNLFHTEILLLTISVPFVLIGSI